MTKAWDPPLITNQGRVPRTAESHPKDFRVLDVGKMHLDPGRGLLTLRTPRVAGKQGHGRPAGYAHAFRRGVEMNARHNCTAW